MKEKDTKTGGLGAKGNKAVALTKRFCTSNGYRFMSPVTINGKKKQASLDALVIGYFGVLGVKVIDYADGIVYGNANEAEWLWIDKKENRTYFENPITETSADVRILRDALFVQKLQQTPIEVVCVFTSKKLQLALPPNTGHYSMSEFKTLLRKEKYKKDTGLDLDKVQEAFRKAE